VWSALHDYITGTICGFPVRLVLVDSGFRPNKPDQSVHKVYDFVRRFTRGKVYASKGSSHSMAKPLHVSKQEVTPKGKVAKYGIDLLMLDSSYWKSWVHERLHWEKNQLGDWHLPIDTDDEYMKQIISESKVRLPSGKTVWVEHSPQNHFLDCEALQAAGAHMLNTARIPPTAEMMQRRPPFAVSPAPSLAPAPVLEKQSATPNVIPESTEQPTMTAQEYYLQQAERELAIEERAAASNRASWLNPNG
jgi:phage terminase large subunit GpA-like protein